MLPLLFCMGLPLFAVIGYALLSPNPAGGEGNSQPPEQLSGVSRDPKCVAGRRVTVS
jgi:hypothetical protein